MRNKILIILGITGWVILISLVLYFGYQAQIIKHRQEAFNQGASSVIDSIFTQIHAQGEIAITTNQGAIVLVQKDNPKKKKK